MNEIILRTSIVIQSKQTAVGNKVMIDIDDSQLDCAIKYLRCLQSLQEGEEGGRRMNEKRGWILDQFIFELNDNTRWPTEYFKNVIRFYLSDSKVIPRTIHYPRCVRKYQSSEKMKVKVTPNGLIKMGLWSKYCVMRGYNVDIANAVLRTPDEEMELTDTEAMFLGLMSCIVFGDDKNE